MQITLTKAGNEVFSPVDVTGAMRRVENFEAQRWSTEIERYLMAILADTTDLELPNLLITFTVTGGGPNAWTATSNLPIPTDPTSALYLVKGISAANTGPVTLNGKPWRSNSNNDFVPGGIVAGGIYLMLDNGTEYRALNDQVSSSIIAAAEAWAMEAKFYAEQAAAAANITTVPSRAFAQTQSYPSSVTFLDVKGYAAATDGGGGLYRSVVSQPAHDGWFQSADSKYWELFEHTVNPRQFGATANPATDERDILQSFFAYPHARKFNGNGEVFRLDTAIALPSRSGITVEDIEFDYSNGPALTTMMTMAGSISAATNLGGSVLARARTLSVSASAGVIAGDYLMLASNQAWDSTNNCIFSEMVKVNNVAGTVVTLDSPILYTYASGNSARVQRLLFIKDITFRNVRARGRGTTHNQTAFNLSFACDVKFDKCDFSGFENRAVQLTTCANVDFIASRFADTDRAGLGYGVAIIAGCHWIKVIGCKGERNRHGVTIGGTTFVNRYITVANCHFYGQTSAGVDCHPGGDYVDFLDNFIACDQAGGDDGIVHQGMNGTIARNTVTNPGRHGILVQQLMVSTQRGFCKVLDNTVISGDPSSTTNMGIQILTQGATSLIEGLDVTGNTLTGFNTSIQISADGGNIFRFAITNNKNTDVGTGRGLRLLCGTGRQFQNGTISGNSFRVENTQEAIVMNSTPAGGIRYVTVTGNNTFGGSYGIRGINTLTIVTVGNTAVGSTNGINVAGADSIANSNIT